MSCRLFGYVTGILIFVSACSAPKQSSYPRERNSSSSKVVNKNPKFLDDISVDPGSSTTTVKGSRQRTANNDRHYTGIPASSDAGKMFPLQLKYAMLLNAEAQDIDNERMFRYIDEWYGTRYCMGGTSKTCVDCSGFVQNFYSAVYGVSIPRTSKEQYSFAGKISSKKLKEGDLVFFNTRGGVSHVGIYLMNNKFVHASTSAGVVISGLDETYYSKHFIGAGRVEQAVDFGR